MGKTNIIYVITHCESCYNKRGIFTGRVNSKLTNTGHQHADQLAERLKDKKIDIAFTSPLARTRQTLKHILKYHPHTKVIVDQRLIERDYGQLSRKSKQKYQKEHPDLYPVYHRSYTVAPPGGESIQQVETRILSFIDDLLKQIKNESINALIVCHSNSIRPIRRFFEKLSPEEMMKLENLRHTIFTYQIS